MPTIKQLEIQWPSATSALIANGTYDLALSTPWASGMITSVTYQTSGISPSFTFSIQINGVNVTGASGIVVTSSTITTSACTGSNSIATGNHVTLVVSGVTGTVTDPRIQINYSHSVN